MSNEKTPLDPKIIPTFRVELTRIQGETIPHRIDTPEGAAEVLHALLDKSPVERMIVMYMDAAAYLVGAEEVAVGGLESVQVEMKNLYRGAILASVKRIVLGHNHPSGDVTASNEDIKLTAIAVQYGMMLGIEVWDHVVVSPKGDHYSIYAHPERMMEMALNNLKAKPGVNPYARPGANPLPDDLIQKIKDSLLGGKIPPRF